MSGVEALAGRLSAKASTPMPKHYPNVYSLSIAEWLNVQSDELETAVTIHTFTRIAIDT